MKIFYVPLIVIFSMCSCLSTKKSKLHAECNENIEFKKVFFEKVENIENYFFPFMSDSLVNSPTIASILRSRQDTLISSLKFISKYTHVSWTAMLNYNRSYPMGIFKKDKKEWLTWYEANKCGNIEFK